MICVGFIIHHGFYKTQRSGGNFLLYDMTTC